MLQFIVDFIIIAMGLTCAWFAVKTHGEIWVARKRGLYWTNGEIRRVAKMVRMK